MTTCANCGESPGGGPITVAMGLVYCGKGECLDAASERTLAAADAGYPVPRYEATSDEIVAALEAGGLRRSPTEGASDA